MKSFIWFTTLTLTALSMPLGRADADPPRPIYNPLQEILDCNAEKALWKAAYQKSLNDEHEGHQRAREHFRPVAARIAESASLLLGSLSDGERQVFARAADRSDYLTDQEATRLAERRMIPVQKHFDDAGCPLGYALAGKEYYQRPLRYRANGWTAEGEIDSILTQAHTGATWCLYQRGADPYLNQPRGPRPWQIRSFSAVYHSRVWWVGDANYYAGPPSQDRGDFTHPRDRFILDWQDLATRSSVSVEEVLAKLAPEPVIEETEADFVRKHIRTPLFPGCAQEKGQ